MRVVLEAPGPSNQLDDPLVEAVGSLREEGFQPLVLLHLLHPAVQLVDVGQEFELSLVPDELLRRAVLEGAIDTGR